MFNRTDRIKYLAVTILTLQVIALVSLWLIFKRPVPLLAVIVTAVDVVVAAILIWNYENDRKSRVIDVSRVVGEDHKDLMLYGQLGLLTYDDDYVVTWCSELFEERGLSLIGEKLTKSIPGSEILLNGDSDTSVFEIEDRKYEITRGESSRVLFFKDVTEFRNLSETYDDEKVVLGLIHLDNYDETIQYEDEQKIAAINTNIRQKIVEWCILHDAVVRRLRSDRFLVVVNEKNFRTMIDENFSILEEVKQEADNLSVAISASMAFARGTSDLTELDSMINELLELILSRGGDQVAVRAYGQDVKFYGLSSEASEKTSKVRVRVIAQTLRGIIRDADNVFIVPHSEADFDAIGSCLGMSRFVQAFDKDAYIIMKDIDIEASALRAINDNIDEVLARHVLVNEDDALNFLTRDSVVIVCDHHSADLTSAPELVSQAKKVVIIDHHRRKQETDISAMMIYNEPAASSAVELISELIEYQPARVELDEFEATYMYTGILVDTDGFRSKCSSRSFEVCAYLRKEGADITMANEWLKEPLEQFEMRTRILNYSQMVNGNILVAALPEKEGMVTRTMVAQAANHALGIRNVDASFVIAQIEEDTWSISGRSNGKVNVQIILEKMGGGGHFAAAGLQRKSTSTAQLKKELLEVLEEFVREVKANEDNSAE